MEIGAKSSKLNSVMSAPPESLNFSLSVILYEMLAEEIRRFFLEVLLISLMVQ